MPKVTIAIPIYNAAAFIETCVRSVYGQTLDDLEILLIDDCSADNSIALALQILDEYPQRKDQVRVIRNEKNQGIALVRKRMAQEARGAYLMQVDSNDYLELNAAELAYNRAEAENADMVSFERFVHIGEKVSATNHEYDNVDKDVLRSQGIACHGDPIITNRLVHRSLFTNPKVIWPETALAEDLIISAQFFYYAKNLAFITEPLYHYNVRCSSTAFSQNPEHVIRMFEGYKKNLELMTRFYAEHGLTEKCGSTLLYMKQQIKELLLPFNGHRKYRKLYLATFPEVGRMYFFGNQYRKPTYRERFYYVCIVLGIYRPMHRVIYSKYLRPRWPWYPYQWNYDHTY